MWCSTAANRLVKKIAREYILELQERIRREFRKVKVTYVKLKGEYALYGGKSTFVMVLPYSGGLGANNILTIYAYGVINRYDITDPDTHDKVIKLMRQSPFNYR